MHRAPAAPARRRGFTLIEALFALTVASMAAGVALVALETSLQTATDAYEQTLAAGLAEQMIDEALGAMYGDPAKYPLAPSSGKVLGVRRDLFTEVGDYNGYSALGGIDRYGLPLGQDDGAGGLRPAPFRLSGAPLADWRQEFEVYYVQESNPAVRLAAGQTSGLRVIEARISRKLSNGQYRVLFTARRVIAYVPHPT